MADKDNKELFYQELDSAGNPVGPVKSGLMYQELDENGNPVGKPKSGLTFEVIDKVKKD